LCPMHVGRCLLAWFYALRRATCQAAWRDLFFRRPS